MENNNRYELESSLLSCLIYNQSKIAEVATRVAVTDFNCDATRAIYQALVELQADGITADRPLLVSRLNGKFAPAVDDVLAVCHTDAEPYIAELNKLNLIEMYRLAGNKLSAAQDIESAEEEVNRLENAIAQASGNGADGASSLNEMFAEFIDNYEAPRDFLTTSFPALDAEVAAVPGNFIILGGYPSAGKTALSLQLGMKWAHEGKKVIFFSCETNKFNLTCRILSYLTHIPMKAFIRREPLTTAQMNLVRQAQVMINADGGKHFLVINSACQSPDFVRAQTIAHHADVVFIDYLQLLHGSRRKGFENRQNEVAEVSRALADLARRQNIIVIALSQLTRPGAPTLKGEVKIPDMHSFKESGQLEQDADIALVLFSETPFDSSDDCPRVLRCVKNKQGKCPDIRLKLHGDWQTFEDIPSPPATQQCDDHSDYEPLPF
ncbi:MAG: replicative DNA helicase [Candidatus Limivicinus sp.]|jgi:replicative DNA helicase